MSALWITVAVVTYLVSVYLISGMLFSDSQHVDPSTAKKCARSEAGQSMGLALAWAMFGPFGVLFAFLITGFAEHGIGRSPK